MENKLFILDGTVTNVSKGAYNKNLKHWEIRYTVAGKAGKWELDAPLNEDMTATFTASGDRYRIVKKLKIGQQLKVYGWQSGNEFFCGHWTVRV